MDINKMPKHVAIIMDGNGRWAKEKGYPRSYGHLMGSKMLEKVALHIFKCGIKILSVFAFSTDNFKRSKEEVDYLMNLFIKMFDSRFKVFMKNGIKVVFSGRRNNLREDVISSMDNIATKTQNNKLGILNICLNYGGQEEIIDAVNKIIASKQKFITKEDFYYYLYQDLPKVDFLIRTSGEYRISNFMIYESAYAEYYFTDVYFPDFNAEEFDKALKKYFNRDRRYGGINYETKGN